MATETKIIIDKLNEIKTELDYIKENMVNIDTILTPKEEVELEESLKELKESKTFSLEDIKKNRKNA